MSTAEELPSRIMRENGTIDGSLNFGLQRLSVEDTATRHSRQHLRPRPDRRRLHLLTMRPDGADLRPRTTPVWTPYQGTAIEDAVTFGQGNSWHNNTYSGPWQFMALDTRKTISFDVRRAAPYSQDAGSTLTQTASAKASTTT